MKYIKQLIAISVLVAIVCFNFTNSTSAATNLKGKTNVTNLNIRIGPGTNYKIAYTLKKNSIVDILEIKGNWYKLKYGKKIGWGVKSYIHVQPPITLAKKEIKYTVANVNFRMTPSTKGKSISVLKKGTGVEFICVSGSFSKVKFNGKTGYISSNYLISNIPVKVTTINPTYYTTISGAYLYNKYDATKRTIATIPSGTTVIASQIASNGFIKISMHGIIGYIDQKKLNLSNPITFTNVNLTYYIASNSTNLYDSFGSKKELITLLQKDTAVTVTEKISNGFVKLKVNGIFGYAELKNITSVKPITFININKTYYVIPQTATLYDSFNADRKYVGSIKKDTSIQVTQLTSNGYAKINVFGETYYIELKYLTDDKPVTFTEVNDSYSVIPAKTPLYDSYTATKQTIGSLPLGSIVVVTQLVNSTYGKTIFEGKTGYVSLSDLKKYPKAVVVVESNSNLNFHTQPNISSDVIKSYPLRTPVTVYGEMNGWYQVKLPNGIIAWGDKKYIQDAVKYYSTSSNFTNQLNPGKYQFLKINRFREVDLNKVNEFLNGLKYYKAGQTHIFDGQGQNFINAAKSNNIDVAYLIAHTIHETGYGTSSLAQGYDVELGTDGKARIYTLKNSKGEIIASSVVKLKDSTTPLGTNTIRVHNFFGIGAYDGYPIAGGTTYAYEHGWIGIESTISKSAQWISELYVNSPKYQQNTVYKMRFNRVVPWHQYATDPAWAYLISKYMDTFINVNNFYKVPLTDADFEVPLN